MNIQEELRGLEKWINSNVVYDNSLKENLSPKHLLEFIDNKITD